MLNALLLTEHNAFPVLEDVERNERVVGLVNERSFLSFCAAGVPGSTAPAFTPVASIMTPLDAFLKETKDPPIIRPLYPNQSGYDIHPESR